MKKVDIRWVRWAGVPGSCGALFYLDGELVHGCFTGSDMSGVFDHVSRQVPDHPDPTANVPVEYFAKAMLESLEVARRFYVNVIELKDEMVCRLNLGQTPTDPSNAATLMWERYKENDLHFLLNTAFEDWIPPAVVAPATPVATPAPRPSSSFAPPSFALADNLPEHLGSGAHLAGLPDAVKSVRTEVAGLLGGTEHLDEADIVEALDGDKHA
jgi:hypothetical protein